MSPYFQIRLRSLNVGNVALGMLSICLVRSSNYVLNEILDAPMDRFHPSKSNPPVPASQIRVPLAYLEWILLMAAALGLGSRL